jgi:hypothetical protein
MSSGAGAEQSLRELAHFLGIQLSYMDNEGNERITDDETLEAVVRAFDITLECP